VFHVVLFNPEIPPNTGNIIRLCANTGASLHLIRPLGFDINDRKLKRAGLDYHEYANVQLYDSLDDFLTTVAPPRLFACSTHGAQCYAEVEYNVGDALLFGPETRGLPRELLAATPSERVIRVPMRSTSRSLNLANVTAIILYEAWRQHRFDTLL